MLSGGPVSHSGVEYCCSSVVFEYTQALLVPYLKNSVFVLICTQLTVILPWISFNFWFYFIDLNLESVSKAPALGWTHDPTPGDPVC